MIMSIDNKRGENCGYRKFLSQPPPLWHKACPCGMLVSNGTNSFSYIKDNISLALMHRGIVSGHQLLYDAHTVPDNIGEL